MRLVECKNAGEFRLVEFSGHDIPQYAILSHTWRADGAEVTYKDMMENTGKDKAGYAKVRFCGEQALRDDIHYFWMDTCCINKSDLAELSEAINSMFRWYRRAAICYVYLSDVPAHGSGKRIRDSLHTWESGFRKSRWFTRGWTLQELIAPTSVEFFSLEYERLGDKKTLAEQIRDVTGIDAEALQGRPLSHFTVAERMSWAKKRETTREEDEAYCLLGVFEINLVPMYGEGKKNAFTRLDEGINKPSKNKPIALSPDLRNLPYAKEAPFDSDSKQQQPSCRDGTQVDVLREIYNWADGQEERCIFWLSGSAGTGKSTIARTIAKEYSEKNRLGASFFFSKGGGDVSNTGVFFTSIAAQLASKIPLLQSHINNAIAKYKDISSRSLPVQWRELIISPLSKIDNDSLPSSYLLVIDALDECDDDKGIRIILQLVLEVRSLSKVTLRVLLTSRPEVPASQSFHGIERRNETIILHHLSPAYHDIPDLLEYKLTRIRWECDDLPSDWPGEQNSRLLVQIARGFFIIAITICEFIKKGGKSAAARLSIILDDKTSVDDLSTKNDCTHEYIKENSTIEQENPLERVYTAILGYSASQYNEGEREEWCRMLRKIAGAIVLLFSPLSTSSIARLVQTSLQDFTRILDSLQTFISVPRDRARPIRLHHPSFRDFLLSQLRCSDPRFWIDEKQAHQDLANNCIQLMRASLRQDICAMEAPGALVVDMRSSRLERFLPTEVQYACLYWVKHLQMGGLQLHDNDQVHQFLQDHLLHWLEALSWMQKVSDGIVAIISLEAIALAQDCHHLHALIYDMKRFTLNSRTAIEQAPLQIYSSALFFAPTMSIVRNRFKNKITPWLKTLPNVPPDWSALLQALEGHSSWVNAIAFSPDGKVLASASQDGAVQLCNASSGEELLALEAHSTAVAFSPDGKVLALALLDSTVRLYDGSSGVQLLRLQSYSNRAATIAFSLDGKVLAFGGQEVILLWDTSSGAELSRLKGYWGRVAFSPDVKILASARYKDGIMRLWDTSSGVELSRLEGGLGVVRAVTFSTNGKMLASAGYNGQIVRLWDTQSGVELFSLEGNLGTVSSLAFSPNGEVFASASYDRIVRLWHIGLGTELLRLEGDTTDIAALAFSSDGKILASTGYGVVRLWDTSSQVDLSRLNGRSELVRIVEFSPNGKLLASIGDETVRFWDTSSGEESLRLEGDWSDADTITFSPDGKILALGRLETVILWDTSSWVELLRLGGDLVPVSNLAFSHDSKVLVSTSCDYDFLLWDAGSGAELLRLKKDSYSIETIAYSPDSDELVSASPDETVGLWDTRSEAFLRTRNTDTVPYKLLFKFDASCLETSKGPLDLTSLSSALARLFGPDYYPSSRKIYIKWPWLVRGSEKLLWLPLDNRPYCVAVHKCTVALVHLNGEVSFLELPQE